jgi:hypothetical protein
MHHPDLPRKVVDRFTQQTPRGPDFSDPASARRATSQLK